jgi:hypothetical protein
METTIVDRLYEDNRVLADYLEKGGENSLLNHVDSHFRKTLLLSAASFFETVIKDDLLRFVEERTKSTAPLMYFVKNKAIERQYHTFFNWDQRNANSFFGLFGSEFKEFMETEVKTDAQLGEGIRAFLELGAVRNHLVHQNFGTFPLEKTTNEIYDLYKKASIFVERFPQKLRQFVEKLASVDEQ